LLGDDLLDLMRAETLPELWEVSGFGEGRTPCMHSCKTRLLRMMATGDPIVLHRLLVALCKLFSSPQWDARDPFWPFPASVRSEPEKPWSITFAPFFLGAEWMRRRRLGLLGDPEDDDPMSGVANLLDTAMVFAVALLLALVVSLISLSCSSLREI
jgi:hypothetical protein